MGFDVAEGGGCTVVAIKGLGSKPKRAASATGHQDYSTIVPGDFIFGEYQATCNLEYHGFAVPTFKVQGHFTFHFIRQFSLL